MYVCTICRLKGKFTLIDMPCAVSPIWSYEIPVTLVSQTPNLSSYVYTVHNLSNSCHC